MGNDVRIISNILLSLSGNGVDEMAPTTDSEIIQPDYTVYKILMTILGLTIAAYVVLLGIYAIICQMRLVAVTKYFVCCTIIY